MGGDVDGWAARIHLGAHQEPTEARRGAQWHLGQGCKCHAQALASRKQGCSIDGRSEWRHDGPWMEARSRWRLAVAAQRLQEPAVACSCEETRRKMGKRIALHCQHESRKPCYTPTQRHGNKPREPMGRADQSRAEQESDSPTEYWSLVKGKESEEDTGRRERERERKTC
ncbi:hypothetical protein J3F84DRAFT_82031 [Trichoderma pleuroticola]